jgi:hypothetical protein
MAALRGAAEVALLRDRYHIFEIPERERGYVHRRRLSNPNK